MHSGTFAPAARLNGMRVALYVIAFAACGNTAQAPTTPVAPAPTPTPARSTETEQPASSIEASLLHGHPTTGMFDELVAQFPAMSSARRAAIAALGTSQDKPIHVPAINYEYVWVDKIACNGGVGNVGTQSLLSTPQGDLDELAFTCPGDATEHAAYFDFSDDPSEQQMRKELGGS